MALLTDPLAWAALGAAILLVLFTWRRRGRSTANGREHGLVNIPKTEQDLTCYYAASMALFLVLALAACWAATEYAAWVFNWPPVFRGCTSPGPAQAAIFDRAQFIVGAGIVFVLLAPALFIFRRSQRIKSARNDLHGSAHWAVEKEVEATQLLPSEANRGGVVFGTCITCVSRDPST